MNSTMMMSPSAQLSPSVAIVCSVGSPAGSITQKIAGLSSFACTRRRVAAVATAFPSGRASLEVKLADTTDAVSAGADEIDMVIDRGAFLAGQYGRVFDQIVAVKEACRRDDGTYAHLKVILETGELTTYDNVRR